MDQLFEILNIHKIYKSSIFKKKVHALNGFSLNFPKGQVFGLIGPNGAGKSSTIRLMLGLSKPDSGSILFRGRPVSCNLGHKEIGYLPENPYLYDHLTLRELLDFCGRISGLSSLENDHRRRNLLSKLDMERAQNRPLRTLSKGMLQRAGLCFALLHDPEVVILDEPMSGLDPIGRKLVFDLIMELKGKGKTIFFCSHILSDVERLCDRMGLLHQGRLVRTFDRSDFSEDLNASVHFNVSPLSAEQKDVLARNNIRIQDKDGGPVLSSPGSKVAATAQLLAEMGIEIRGSRTERVSLEEIFILSIQGAKQ